MLNYQRVNIEKLVGSFNHLEKWWSSSMGRIIPYRKKWLKPPNIEKEEENPWKNHGESHHDHEIRMWFKHRKKNHEKNVHMKDFMKIPNIEKKSSHIEKHVWNHQTSKERWKSHGESHSDFMISFHGGIFHIEALENPPGAGDRTSGNRQVALGH